MDLAAAADWAHDFRETFQARGYELMIGPMVVAELEWLAQEGDARESSLARRALASLVTWRTTVFQLNCLEFDLARSFAGRLQGEGLLPVEEFNDGVILASTSLAEIPALVTGDRHLLGLDGEALLLAFNEAGLTPVQVAHPRLLARALR